MRRVKRGGANLKRRARGGVESTVGRVVGVVLLMC